MKRLAPLALASLLAGCIGMQRPDDVADPLSKLDLAPSAPAAARKKSYSSDVDKPAYSLSEADNRYAVVVGVEDYESLPSADFAERDAAAMRDHLLALGYAKRNVVLLTGREASRAGIEKYVESWLPGLAREDSSVLFYFSGHGAPDVKSGAAYLVPWDGDPKFLDNTAYPVKRLYEKLNALKAAKVVVALDACFSGAGGRSVLPKGARPLVNKLDSGASSAGRLVILAAAAKDEITGSLEGQGHGAFTYYLLKGLNDRDGRASVKQLYDYLLPKVGDAARADNRDQTPQLISASPDAAKETLR